MEIELVITGSAYKLAIYIRPVTRIFRREVTWVSDICKYARLGMTSLDTRKTTGELSST